MNVTLTVNGLKIDAHYGENEIEHVHKPLLRRIAKLSTQTSRHRTIIFLCAPPGTGKSTLTTFWEYLSRQDASLPDIQTLPMDGFHHYNSWLDEHKLRPFKGSPDTFNVEKLAQNLRQIREGEGDWPQYDRQTHNPIEGEIKVTAPIVIIEGNWLLLDNDKWRQLLAFCDETIFIKAPSEVLKNRLIARKCSGGMTMEDAIDFYQRTDGPNVELVLTKSQLAGITLEMDISGKYFLD